jgi:MoxR-like ATPase
MNEVAFTSAMDTAHALRDALATVIKGRVDTIQLVLCSLFADGHVLLEDYPGSGKTTLTKTLGKLIAPSPHKTSDSHIVQFRRIQFTPDLLPGDVLGVTIYDPKSSRFQFIHGPVFAHVVLADEINRTGPKVQAAFLECMAEKQVTIDNNTYKLDELFFVVGTQNPLDIAGTYPLPIVQLDRFLLKIPMSYVDAKTETEILRSHIEIKEQSETIQPVCSRDDIIAARKAVDQVYVSDSLRQAIVDIVHATRNSSYIQFGASTRAALMLQAAIRSWALLSGRDHATEDDLKTIAPYVLLHRIKFQGTNKDGINLLRNIMEPHLEALIRRGVR